MSLLLIARGRFREPALYHQVQEEMRLYGEVYEWLNQEDLAVACLREKLSSVSSGTLSVASAQLSSRELDEALSLAERGEFHLEAASRWPHAALIAYEAGQGRLYVVRGEFCPAPMMRFHEGADFLIAPTGKAQRKFPELVMMKHIEKGQTLLHEAGSETVSLYDARRDWSRDGVGTHDYEEDKAELKRLFREGVRDALNRGPCPMALSLSGGLDSSIVAQTCAELGERLPAFNVSFEQRGARVPLDLRRARLTAKKLDLELHEIVVTRKELPPLIRETVVRTGTRMRFTIEGLVYLVRMCQELERRGFGSYLMGTGVDALLGSHRDLNGPETDEAFQTAFLRMFRSVYGLDSTYLIQRSFRPEFIQPLVNERIEAFCLRLPRQYLVEGVGDSFIGKKIARNAYADVLPPEVLRGGKSMPPSTTGSERLIKEIFGSEGSREAYYRDLYYEHVLGQKIVRRPWYRRLMTRWPDSRRLNRDQGE